ncbi:MAG: PPC domain-containing protein, partial [Planctomycetaceae bacterium]
MPVVFEAAADAPIAGKLVAFTARHSDPNVKISGRFENTADLVRYRNNQILWKKDVERLAMAVIDEVPFKLEIVQPKVPIVRDGAMQLKIVAHKKEGWDEQINVQFPFRPPGIGAASSVNMPKGQNEVLYPLNANGGAAIGKWPVYVIGSANVNGAAWAASQLAELEIADRYVQFEITRTAVEQGQSTQLFCKITHNRPFEGAAKVQLLGLPNKVAAPELEFTKDTAELVFNVTTDPASPAGRHKNVFAQVTIMENGEPIVHRNVGSTELRIDKPLPVAAKPAEQPKPEPTAKAEEPKKPAEKPLTRLEQLRLEAKKRAEAATSGGGGSE